MTIPIIIASVITGLIVGWWLTATMTSAAMSRSQERMQRHVRRWQGEARRAQTLARQVIEDLTDQMTRSAR